MSVIELFGAAALIALGAGALVLIWMLVREPRSWEGAAATEDDQEAVDADRLDHGVRDTY